MSRVRSFGRVWVGIVIVAFICAFAVFATPALAAEQSTATTVDKQQIAKDVARAQSDEATEADDADAGLAGPSSDKQPGAATDDSDKSEGAGGNIASGTASDEKDDASDAETNQGAQNKNEQSPAASAATKPAAEKPAATKPAAEKPATAVSTAKTESDYAATHTNMYRLYNPNSGEHFYTASLYEAKSVAQKGWRWEGIGWVSPLKGTPVYRLYNPNAGDHHYTTSAVERRHLMSVGWRNEGIGWYSDGNDQTAVLRQYNSHAKAGAHNFTTSRVENDHLGSVGWRREGVAWYATKGDNLAVKGFWLITSAWGSKQRYWVASDGNIAKSRFIEASEGAGYDAYAKGDGSILRGKLKRNNNSMLLADNNGRLASTSNGEDGWILTAKYDNGMQRYYYSKAKRGVVIGFFTIDGKQYYGTPNEGYVARGKQTWKNFVLLSNNDGVLSTAEGWLITSKYDKGTQRYWMAKATGKYMGAKTGLFTVAGKQYYGTPELGYVARNRYVSANKRWYKANNDGVLSESVSPAEGDMMMRAQGMSSNTNYLVLVDTNGCKVGVFKGGKNNWDLARFESCVCGAPGSPTIRGTYSTGYHLPVLPDWSNALYCTNITGGYFFHSVLNSTSELGQHLSHGCVRLDWNYAKYMQTLPYGSKVHLY